MSPQIFETVDLMTRGFTPEYGNRFSGVLDITIRSGADLAGTVTSTFGNGVVRCTDLGHTGAQVTAVLWTAPRRFSRARSAGSSPMGFQRREEAAASQPGRRRLHRYLGG